MNSRGDEVVDVKLSSFDGCLQEIKSLSLELASMKFAIFVNLLLFLRKLLGAHRILLNRVNVLDRSREIDIQAFDGLFLLAALLKALGRRVAHDAVLGLA